MYTKGQWKVTTIVESPKYECLAITDDDNRTLAKILDGGYKEKVANANLIAASPDMYEFCRELLMSLDTGYERLGARREGTLRQALAKAEGKEE